MQDISYLTELNKSDAMSCSSRSATYMAFVLTTTRTFKKDPSMLEIWSFAASRMKLGCTSSTCDGRGPSSCSRLQD
jgi:hypothetical protein